MTRPTVLVVENNASNAELVEALLALDGWDVAHASGGAEALQLLSLGAVPDAVLLDLLMPGVDGVTVLREMYARDPLRPVPVVVLSAAGEDTLARAREAHPGVRVLRKPAGRGEILAALAGAKAPRSEARPEGEAG